jgi:hypothetical protein
MSDDENKHSMDPTMKGRKRKKHVLSDLGIYVEHNAFLCSFVEPLILRVEL